MSILKQIQSRRSLSEGLRKIGELHSDSGDHHATIHKDHEWGEYRVKFHSKGVHNPDADYHTDDKDDAHGTAEAGLKHLDATHKTVHEDVEQIDELKKSTLANYIHKASRSLDNHTYKVGKHDGGVEHGANMDRASLKSSDVHQRKSRNRMKGISAAAHRLSEGIELDSQLTEEHFEFILDVMTVEEFEKLDEISKQTVASYAFKARNKIAVHDGKAQKHADAAKHAEKEGSFKDYNRHSDEALRHNKKADVHTKGLKKAIKRLAEIVEDSVNKGGRPKKQRTLDGKIAPGA